MMRDNTHYSIFEWMPLPKRCIVGLQEKLSFVGDREIARTVNGRAVVLQPSYGSLYSIELSNSGPNVWLPYQFEIGQRITLLSQTWQSVILGQGETVVFLPRNPVIFTVSARDVITQERVGVVEGFSHRVVIEQRGNETMIAYRMRLNCIVSDFQSSGSATSRDQSWTLKLEEVGG